MKPKLFASPVTIASVFLSAIMLIGVVFTVYGQDIERRTSVQADDTIWYMQPWVWAIAVAVLAVAIAYFSRGSGRKQVKDTTEKGLH